MADIERLRRIVALSKRLALVLVAVSVPCTALFVWGMSAGEFGCVEFAIFFAASISLGVSGVKIRAYENEIRGMPASPALEAARADAIKGWR